MKSVILGEIFRRLVISSASSQPGSVFRELKRLFAEGEFLQLPCQLLSPSEGFVSPEFPCVWHLSIERSACRCSYAFAATSHEMRRFFDVADVWMDVLIKERVPASFFSELQRVCMLSELRLDFTSSFRPFCNCFSNCAIAFESRTKKFQS